MNQARALGYAIDAAQVERVYAAFKRVADEKDGAVIRLRSGAIPSPQS